jgi:RNA polymerase sigma-70 factor (ECF subfamily)
MTATVPAPGTPSLRTRSSLVAGLQAGDENRWTEFFRLYGPVIRGFALKAGLTETESDEVVQETCIGVARNVESYRYDPAKCRFKTWLLNLTSWRVKNQFTRRRRWDERKLVMPDAIRAPEATGLPEPVAEDQWDALWEAEWREGLLASALEKVRAGFSATQFQIFDLNAMKGWPARDVAKALGVSVAGVYLAKHRVSAALRREIARLERNAE